MQAIKKKAYKMQPRQKLRRINWQKVNERALKGTFWEDLDEEMHAQLIDWEYACCVPVESSAVLLGQKDGLGVVSG
jgi:hypothetical protein